MENIAKCGYSMRLPDYNIGNTGGIKQPDEDSGCFDGKDWTTNAANAVGTAFSNMDKFLENFEKDIQA